jgi:hypothetical protein
MAVSGHPIRAKAHGGLGRAEEGLSGLHVAVLAQHGVDQVSVPVDRPITVTPLAPDLQLRLLYPGPVRQAVYVITTSPVVCGRGWPERHCRLLR